MPEVRVDERSESLFRQGRPIEAELGGIRGVQPVPLISLLCVSRRSKQASGYSEPIHMLFINCLPITRSHVNCNDTYII